MRVGLLIYGNLGNQSGGYLYDRKLVEFLEAQGDEVEVVSLPRRNYIKHLGDNFSQNILNRLQSLDIDVLIQDELNHPSLFWLNRKLQKDIDYPIISIVHHLRSREKRWGGANWFYNLVERAYLKTLDGLALVSQNTRRDVEALIGPVKPYVVAYPAGNRLGKGASVAEIRTRVKGEKGLRVLFLGSITRRKNPHILVEAAAQIDKEDLTLTMVGNLEDEPPYASRVRRKALGLLGNRVEFTGHLDKAGLLKILAAHDILVVPSSLEGYGIVYLEGMSFGLPAVGSTAAAGEIITHAEDGYLVAPGQVEELVEVLTRLYKDRGLLLKLSLAARQRYESQPTWEDCGAQIREFLLKMI